MRLLNGKYYQEKADHDFDEFVEIIALLRSENGCKWDLAQTHETMRKCMMDEAEEVCRAIDNKDDENLCEELGDVLMQVVLNARIAQERGAFDLKDVIQGVSEKLIRRHPHVFGDETAESAEEALAIWKRVKQEERAARLAKSKEIG